MDCYEAISYYFNNNTIIILIAGACRLKVVSKYPRQFRSPADTERHYFQEHSESPMTVEELPTKHSVSTQTESVQESTSTDVNTTMRPAKQAIQRLGRRTVTNHGRLVF